MSLQAKLQPLMILCAVLLGLALGRYTMASLAINLLLQIGPLIELPILSIISSILLKWNSSD